jgi:hypothetical protein
MLNSLLVITGKVLICYSAMDTFFLFYTFFSESKCIKLKEQKFLFMLQVDILVSASITIIEKFVVVLYKKNGWFIES